MSEVSTATVGAESAPATDTPTAESKPKKTPRPKVSAEKAAAKGKDKKKAPAKKAPAKKAPAKKAPAKPAKKAAAPKADGAKRGRASAFAGMKLYKLVPKNPRREGTAGHNSFGLITNGMKYEKFIELGGRAGDLKFDVAHKYVQVKKD